MSKKSVKRKPAKTVTQAKIQRLLKNRMRQLQENWNSFYQQSANEPNLGTRAYAEFQMKSVVARQFELGQVWLGLFGSAGLNNLYSEAQEVMDEISESQQKTEKHTLR